MSSRTAVGDVKTPVTPLALDDRPRRVGVRVVERALVGDRRRAGHERRVDDVAVADDPADVGRRPPGLAGAEAEHPVAHRGDVDAVAAVAVDGELGLGRRAGRREDERRIVGGGVRDAAVVAVAGAEQLVPRQLPLAGWASTRRPRRRTTTCSTSPRSAARASSTIDSRSTSLPFRYVTSVVSTSREPLARIRSPSAPAPKPAKTTQWIAPIRTVASIATIASAEVGM